VKREEKEKRKGEKKNIGSRRALVARDFEDRRRPTSLPVKIIKATSQKWMEE